MPGPPFFLLRPYLLVRDVVVDRNDPDLVRLAAIRDPERFVWAILPHAARTFSACIALLPAKAARAAAVAYLYCRMLDTYEDLVPDPEACRRSLAAFAARFPSVASGPSGSTRRDRVRLPPAPPILDGRARDQRDAAHLLLVERHALVDKVYATLDGDVRALIGALVDDMSAGMRWSSQKFSEQGGVLSDEKQLARYCRNVIGYPVLFASRLVRLQQTGSPALPPSVEADAMTVGEMVQLANVTRDIEKDLRRGIAYHPSLAGDLARDAADPEFVERVRQAREDMLRMALERAPAYRRLTDFLSPSRISLVRASSVLMMLFTDRYFRSCARRAGLRAWRGRRTGLALILAALPAACSRRWADRLLAGIEREFLRAAGATA